jgi:hypothetical protein
LTKRLVPPTLLPDGRIRPTFFGSDFCQLGQRANVIAQKVLKTLWNVTLVVKMILYAQHTVSPDPAVRLDAGTVLVQRYSMVFHMSSLISG